MTELAWSTTTTNLIVLLLSTHVGTWCVPFVVKVKKNCLCNFHAYQYLAICYLCFTGVLARRKVGNSDLGSSMKYPNRHGRPGPYTFRQHQCIKTLNQAIDLRDDFSYHIDSLQTANDHLSTVKRICFDHRKVIRACGGTVNLSTSTGPRWSSNPRPLLPITLTLYLWRRSMALLRPSAFTSWQLGKPMRGTMNLNGECKKRWWMLGLYMIRCVSRTLCNYQE